ncbi:MAG: M56 family metallopeptidase, partial [Planctomycetota bacterium]
MMLPLDMLNEPVWQRLAWTLLHFVWQGLVVAAGVTLLRLLVPWRRPQARYALYLTGLLLMAACPLVTFALVQAPMPAEDPGPPGQATDVPELVVVRPGEGEPTASVALPNEAPLPDETTSIRQAKAAREEGEQTASDNAPPAPGLEGVSWVARIDESVRLVQPYGLVVWMVGVFLLGVRLLLSFGGIRWLIRNRYPISAELASRAVELGNRFGLRRVPAVFVCERIREAIVVGVLRPMILLPGCWTMEMTPAVLEAVIAHELAHIRRWDTWVNLLQRLAETLLFYHPAVWWLSHRLSLEREMCTDELAVEATGQRMTYATTLELLGRKRLNLARAQLGVAIGGSRMALLDRVRNVLRMSPSSERAQWWPVGVLVLLVPMAMVLAGTAGLPAGAESSENEGEPGSAMSGEPDMRTVGDSAEDPAAPAINECTLAGQVLDDRGAPVVGACVVVYDQKSGIPLMQEDYELFTQHLQRRGGKSNLAHAITDDKGGFRLKRVPAGQYRLVAQSWEQAGGGQNLFDITSKVVHLRGVAERVRVSPESSPTVILRPLGTGILQIDDNTKDYLEYYPEYDGIEAVLNKQMFLLVVSKSPLKADPILGFPAWGGAFLQGALGATRKPPGKMTIRGLPKGKVHLALGFWSDQDSGFAAAEADIQPKATANLRIPIMARWAKDRFRPPQRLVPLAEAVEKFGRNLAAELSSEARPYAYMQMVMKTNGISFRPQEGDYVLHGLREIIRHKDREARLPQGGKATFGDVMAACHYVELARQRRERAKKSTKGGTESGDSSRETATPPAVGKEKSADTAAAQEGPVHIPPPVVTVHRAEGPLEFGKEIPVQLRVGKVDGSFAVKGRSIRFIRHNDQIRVTL